MSIFIDKNGNGTYGKHKNQITTKKSSYEKSNLFFIITHTETNPEPSKPGVRDTTYLTLTSNQLGSIRSFFIDDARFVRAEVYFLVNTDKPLILVIVTNRTRCFRLSELKKVKAFTDFSYKSFSPNQLLDKLIEENNKQNNVITYRLHKKTNDNYDGITLIEPKDHPSFEKYKHTPKDGLDGKTVYVLYNGKQLQLSARIRYSGKETNLEQIQEQCYCELTVYYFKLSNTDSLENLPIYLVLNEKPSKCKQPESTDTQSKTYYLERDGYSPLFWKQIDNPNLKNLITYLLDKKTGSYNENSVTITSESNPSFDVYSHKPESQNANKNSYLRFKDHDLELIQNDLIEEGSKLKDFNGNVYCSATIFYYNEAAQSQKPAFLELIQKGTGACLSEGEQECTSNSGSNCYLFQINDSIGLKWIQIGYQDLRNTLTYQLEFKTNGQKINYNNGSVNVSESYEGIFDVYTHTPNENHKQKLGMLLYNWNLVVYQPNDSVDGARLNSLQNKKYSNIVSYYLNKPIVSKPPLFLKLTILTDSGDGTTTDYLLQRIDEKGLLWKQITKINLSNVVTYNLDLSENGRNYNPIKVTKEDATGSFEKYSHKPIDGSNDKTGLLLYKGSLIVLDKSTGDGVENKLTSLYDKKYSEVNAYYPNKSNSYPPLFLELVVKDTESGSSEGTSSSKTYWIQKNNPNGLIWKPINDPKLADFIYYKLEQKNKPELYNTIIVNREYDRYSKMDKYTHKSSEPLKKGLLLYNSNLLVFQSNVSIKQNERLEKLEDKTFCKVDVYYRRSSSTEPPLFLELFETSETGSSQSKDCQCPNTITNGNCKCYWLERLDTNGIYWKQTIRRSDFNDLTNFLMEINRNDKSSIIVHLALKASYDMKTIKYYEINTKGSQTYPPMQVKVEEKHTLGSSYKYYTHDFSGSAIVSDSNSIVSLKIYFKGYEVILQNISGKTLKFNYYPGRDKSKILTTYFYTKDDLALMLNYDGKFYKPKSLKDYFTWKEVTGLASTTDTEPIKKELDNITKEFNEIKLNLTSVETYGKIEKSGHDGILDVKPRITVTTQAPTDNSFKKIKHTTTNTGPIGRVTHNNDELKVIETETKPVGVLKSMSTEINNDGYNTVYAYYHTSDSSKHKPLLLGIAKGDTKSPDMFFERVDNSHKSNWKRVANTNSLGFDKNLTDRINEINYNIKKSIVIKLEQQTSPDYDLMLVKNGTKSTSHEDQGNGAKINVCDDTKGCNLTDNYKCYKHTINQGTGISLSDVAGLRFFLQDREITFSNSLANLGKLVIYINNIQVCIYVYFHNGSTVPLLLKHNDKYYGPTSRDKYFDSWEEKSDIRDTLKQELNQINKTLNDVDITMTKKGNYGIPKPLDPPKELGSSFYERISVKYCKNGNYRKITHFTIDKTQIGEIYFHGKSLNEIETNTTQANEISVYYHNDDIYFSRPLLILLTSQGGEGALEPSLTGSNKWYKRSDLDGTKWTADPDGSTYESNPERLKDKLTQISTQLFTTLEVEIEKQTEYKKRVFFNNERNDESTIKIDKFGQCGGFPVDGFRCIEHKLPEFYKQINNAFNYQPSHKDPTFVLQPSISEIKLGIFVSSNKVAPLLTYTKNNADTNRCIYIYFVKNTEGDDDTVPLVFNYNSIFYGPSTKNAYFSTWINLNIETTIRGTGGPRPEDKVKENLERIYEMINLIDLSQTSSYGLKCCNDHSYYSHKENKFSTKRVTVTYFENKTGYVMYIHKTVNNTKIGSIMGIDDSYKFDQHTNAIETQRINEVVVVFKTGNTDVPLLVLLNHSAKFGPSYTYGYYHQATVRGDTSTKYNFQPISGGYNLMGILKGESQDGFLLPSEPEHMEPIKSILQTISASPMELKFSSESDLDTTKCKGPVENEKDMITKCSGDDLGEESTDTGGEDSFRGQHVGHDLSPQRLDNSRRVDSPGIPEQVPAAPQAQGLDNQTVSHGSEHQGTLGREEGAGEPRAGSSGRDNSDEGQDDRPKVGLPGPGTDVLGGSAGMGAGAKAGHGAQAPSGTAGKNGETGPQGPPGPGPAQQPPSPGTDYSQAGSTLETTTITHGTQQHQNSGGGNGGHNGGGASLPGAKGKNGDRGETGRKEQF